MSDRRRRRGFQDGNDRGLSGRGDDNKGGQDLTDLEDFDKEEKRLLDLLAQGLSQEFPNPERIGCPDPAVLRGIAFRELRLAEVERWLQHLSTCSPCFKQFRGFQEEAKRQRRRRMTWIATGGAIFTLILAIVAWVWTQRQKAELEVLDLRLVPAVNLQKPNEQELQTLVLYRWARHLIVDLPAGSKPGIEEVAIFSETDVEIFETTATARLERQVVYVEVEVDASRVQPGQYFLGVRQPGLTWTEYRVRIP